MLEHVVLQLVKVAHQSEELLDELNSLDETGLSLLHYVSFYNYAHLIPVLLSHGAHINQQSTQGHTPLHLAAGCGHTAVVEALIQAGADVHICDFDGFTAMDRAERSGQSDVVVMLRREMEEDESKPSHSMDLPEPVPETAWLDDVEMAFDTESQGTNEVPCSPQDRCAHQAADEIVDSRHQSQEYDAVNGGLSTLREDELTDVEMLDMPAMERESSVGGSSKSRAYIGDNHEHNRKLLLGAFSTMSLHDKCALSLGMSRDISTGAALRRRGSSVGDDQPVSSPEFVPITTPPPSGGFIERKSSVGSSPGGQMGTLESSPQVPTPHSPGVSIGAGETDGLCDADVKSVIAEDEENLTKLEAAMQLMGPEELQSLEEEARVIQHNVRAWLLRRNCRHMRETTKKLHEAARSIEEQEKKQREEAKQAIERELMAEQEMTEDDLSERERAAITVQAAARTMLARRSFLQTRNVTIKVQAATRGVLCRKNFARMKTHALASLVIQRNVREWLSKQQQQDTDGSDLSPFDSTEQGRPRTGSGVSAGRDSTNEQFDAEELERELASAG
ncbi:hypothetical protein PINS_up008117 [Pythium insidiosum]|nr:hypothetical protein PINS_up008117 [Pythium insidiosum]